MLFQLVSVDPKRAREVEIIDPSQLAKFPESLIQCSVRADRLSPDY